MCQLYTHGYKQLSYALIVQSCMLCKPMSKVSDDMHLDCDGEHMACACILSAPLSQKTNIARMRCYCIAIGDKYLSRARS